MNYLNGSSFDNFTIIPGVEYIPNPDEGDPGFPKVTGKVIGVLDLFKMR